MKMLLSLVVPKASLGKSCYHGETMYKAGKTSRKYRFTLLVMKICFCLRLKCSAALSVFLGLEYEEERLKRSIYNSDFKQLLANGKGERGSMKGCKETNSFFWKGKIGNYHDFLSKEQIDKIVKYNYDTMKEFGYIDKDERLTV